MGDAAGTAVELADAIELYRLMVLIRRFDELALSLRLEGKVHGTVHPYIGQEAVAAGVCRALRPSDYIVSNHRGHGHCLAKGLSARVMMAELFGRVDGACHGRGGSMHIADLSIGVIGANGIVGAGLPIAVGAAFAVQETGLDDVVVCFFGEGATGQGVFHEALNLAALWSLPIVFVCENNGYSSTTPMEVGLPQHEVVRFAEPFGIEGHTADGTDVFDVMAAAERAIGATRLGRGPTFVECKTHRWDVHSQRGVRLPDTRSDDQVARAREHDSIANLASTLRTRGVAEADLEAAADWVDATLAEAVEFADRSPFPEARDALEGVYA